MSNSTPTKKADRFWLMLGAVLVLALAGACMNSIGGTPTAVPPTPALTSDAGQPTAGAAKCPSEGTDAPLGMQQGADLKGWLISKPAQPVRGAAQIELCLVGAGGQPVTDAKVTFDTDMTNMRHGPYLTPAEPAGEGRYLAPIRFSMPGPWRIIAIVERPGQETIQLRFEFRVKT